MLSSSAVSPTPAIEPEPTGNLATSEVVLERELPPTHAHTVVEFQRVLELVSGFASTILGGARIRSLRPMSDAGAITGELGRVDAMRDIVSSEAGWPSHPIPELTTALARLRVEGASWNGTEVRAAITLLTSSRLTAHALSDKSRDVASLMPLRAVAAALLREPSLEAELARIVNEDGVVRDDASGTLRQVRKELRNGESDLVRLLERMMAKLDAHHRVDDASVSLRNGRYVIPVRRDGRGALGGIVHDTSASGATFFVEPPAAIEAGNRIRELEAEELRETMRVLAEVTERIRPFRQRLVGTLGALVTLDALLARARYAITFECASAPVADAGTGFEIANGRHPLLLAQGGAIVVPFDLVMTAGERTLLVSGPNTGGKTVLLKALALISLMVQAGIPAPVGVGSRVAIFDQFFADIGDEQSIQASLSTFSAHLRNLTEIIGEATPRSLVLIDELGSGTDPLEGAALGGAILEKLTRRGTTTIATTHLGALKELAHEVPGVVNASLQFDGVAMAPTYRLVKGIPGRSYGLNIARRLRMPEDVLLNAEARVPSGERDVTALLEDLENRRRILETRERDVGERDEHAGVRERLVEGRENAVRDRERELERSARQDARRYLLEARQEIEQVIRELRQAGALQIEPAALQARREAEQRAAAAARSLAQLDDAGGVGRTTEQRPTAVATLTVGSVVEVTTLGETAGRVIELRGSGAVVAVGGMKLTVPLASLRPVSSRRLSPVGDLPQPLVEQADLAILHEVDLRGLRISDLDDALPRALDRAILADLRTLRIIHGKGTGALRERVAELLSTDARVRTFRVGAWTEGGVGVTIAELE